MSTFLPAFPAIRPLLLAMLLALFCLTGAQSAVAASQSSLKASASGSASASKAKSTKAKKTDANAVAKTQKSGKGKTAAAGSAKKSTAKASPSKKTASKKASAKKTSTAKAKSTKKTSPTKTVTAKKSGAAKASVAKSGVNTRARLSQRAAGSGAVMTAAYSPSAHAGADSLEPPRSEVALVIDLESSSVLYEKNSSEVRPIASITKLMTALVVLEGGQPLSEKLDVTSDDIDRLRNSGSRLPTGATLTREELLLLALMSSENRAAHALGRNYPGGITAFVKAMNRKAAELGMSQSRFADPTGLSSENVSTPYDLVKLLKATSAHPLISRHTTEPSHDISLQNGSQLTYKNTNRLLGNDEWNIQVSKTGFIKEAGRCLVMLTRLQDREVAVILLNSNGSLTRFADAVRVRRLIESQGTLAML